MGEDAVTLTPRHKTCMHRTRSLSLCFDCTKLKMQIPLLNHLKSHHRPDKPRGRHYSRNKTRLARATCTLGSVSNLARSGTRARACRCRLSLGLCPGQTFISTLRCRWRSCWLYATSSAGPSRESLNLVRTNHTLPSLGKPCNFAADGRTFLQRRRDFGPVFRNPREQYGFKRRECRRHSRGRSIVAGVGNRANVGYADQFGRNSGKSRSDGHDGRETC